MVHSVLWYSSTKHKFYSDTYAKMQLLDPENLVVVLRFPNHLINIFIGTTCMVHSVLWYSSNQRYTYKVLQTIQMKLILLCVWAEPAVLGNTKTGLKFKCEI
jgi:hypothetical protein